MTLALRNTTTGTRTPCPARPERATPWPSTKLIRQQLQVPSLSGSSAAHILAVQFFFTSAHQ